MTDEEAREYLEDEKKVLDKEYSERFDAIQKLKQLQGKDLRVIVDGLLAHVIECLQKDLDDIMAESSVNVEDKTDLEGDSPEEPDEPDPIL